MTRKVLGEFTDAHGELWTATLEIKDQPRVTLVREGSGGRKDTYHLSQFLSLAGRLTDFTIAGCELGDVDYRLNGSVANAIAQQALGLLSRQDGHYEIRWVPNDPRVPF